MRRRVLSALAVTIVWVGFDSSGSIGSVAHAWGGVPSNCWVTFGGKIEFSTDLFATFGGNVVAPRGSLITGHMTVANHATDTEYFCDVTAINVCECFEDGTGGVLQFAGDLRQLGPGGGPIGTCTVSVYDYGEPGSQIPGEPGSTGPDIIRFDEFTGEGVPTAANFFLLGGNVQIHGCRAFGANGG